MTEKKYSNASHLQDTLLAVRAVPIVEGTFTS
jgi:hypothetical protein